MQRTHLAVAAIPVLVALGLSLGSVGGAAAPPALGPPSVAQATRAFESWVRHRYRDVRGYWTCPIMQVTGNDAPCYAEVTSAGVHHLVGATARLSESRVTFVKPFDESWRRAWSPFSARYFGGFRVPGVASVNSPAFDWAFLGRGLYDAWKKHAARFTAYGQDGMIGGLERFFRFQCSASAASVVCVNAFGDALRYRPPQTQSPAITFLRGVQGIWEMSADGSALRRLTSQPDADPRWSPNHVWIAFARGDDSHSVAGQDIWVIHPDGSAAHRVTDTFPGQAWGPTWSPDSKRIAFVCQRPGQPGPAGICTVRLDGSKTSTVTSGPNDNEPAWSPDGKSIAFVRGSNQTLYVMRAEGSEAHPVLKKSPAEFGGCQQGGPSWAPDSRRIAFECVDRYAIWIVNADGSGARHLVTGGAPTWSPNGAWIAFSAAFSAGSPAAIYKVHPDGTGLARLTHPNRQGDDKPDW